VILSFHFFIRTGDPARPVLTPFYEPMEDKANPLLKPVVRAENAARDRISTAENEAKNELRAARDRAQEMVKTAEAKTREEVRQAVEDARYSGETEAQQILDRTGKEILAMKEKARGRMKEARRVIVERIAGT
jgi:ATP synthase H subunit